MVYRDVVCKLGDPNQLNYMEKTEKIAIKYLLIGLGAGLLEAICIYFSLYLYKLDFSDPVRVSKFYFQIVNYIPNLIIGFVILFDSMKLIRNKISIPLLGFCIPVIGVCFLLIENFLIENLNSNDE